MNKKINFDLRMRVRKYLDYIWYEEKIEKVEEQAKIIDKLSDSLKEELLLEANADIISDIKLFSFNFSEDLLRNTIPLMKEVRYTPGDIIFMKGDGDSKDFYLIRKGKVEIFLEATSVNAPVLSLKKLQKGDIFGEISFFSGQERRACARSNDFTTVYVIKREEFLKLMEKYPRDYQKFCEIKDNINLYSDYSDLYIKCYSCNNSNHTVQQCPLLNYKPIKDILLNRFYISLEQVRKQFKRKNFKYKSPLHHDIIEKKAFQIQMELISSDSDDEEDSHSEESDGNNEDSSQDNLPELKEEKDDNKKSDQDSKEIKLNENKNLSEKKNPRVKFQRREKKNSLGKGERKKKKKNLQ